MFKTRIIWHLPYAMVGGVETLYRTILKYMNTEKFECYVTCRVEIQDWVRQSYPYSVKVIPFTDASSLSHEIQRINPDLIVGTHGHTLYEALHSYTQFPVVEIVHGSHIWVEHNVHTPKHLTKHIVCVSKSAERVFLENSDFNIPTSVIINGIDTDVFYPRKPFQTTARNFAYFGRFLESDKHLTKMIRAFRALGTQHARLFLIGGSSAEIAALRPLARQLKLSTSVRFYEHTPNPERFYNEVDIVTVRSEAEGYCNVVGEAMASGCPVVCYNFGGILDHLEKDTALVANSQQEYAFMLNKIFRDKDLRKEMIAKGHKFIKNKGNAKIMVRAYEDLFERILEGHVEKQAPVGRVIEMPYVGKVLNRGSNPIVGVANPHWHGIYTATKNCTDVVVHWKSDPSVMMKEIVRYKPKHILFSGGCPGFRETARKIRKKYPQYPVSAYYHGGVSHFSFAGGIYGKGERDALIEMINAQKAGIYDKIAVSSPGLAEVARTSGIRMKYTGNLFLSKIRRRKIERDHVMHIGNFNRPLDHKHTSIGFGAAMLVKDSVLHALPHSYRLPFIDYSKVKIHNEMSQDSLYSLYQEMDVCLQLSFIETFNISVLEMWACGVPVLLGGGNYLLYENSGLKAYCGVEDFTNAEKVAEHLRLCSVNRAHVVALQDMRLKELNKQTSQRWKEFFK